MDSIHSGTAVGAVSQTPSNAVPGTVPNASVPSAKPPEASQGKQEAQKVASPQRDPRSLQYQVEGDRVVTTIIDENNKTVVIQIPDAEVIRIAKAIDRMQGFLLQQKA